MGSHGRSESEVDPAERIEMLRTMRLIREFESEMQARFAEEVFWHLDAPIQRAGVDDVPIPFSPTLEDEVVPNTGDVLDAIRTLA